MSTPDTRLIEKIRALASVLQHKSGNFIKIKLTLLLVMLLLSFWSPDAIDIEQWRIWLTELMDALAVLQDILPLLAIS